MKNTNLPFQLTEEAQPDKIINVLSDMFNKLCLLEEQIAHLVADNILLEERVIELEDKLS